MNIALNTFLLSINHSPPGGSEKFIACSFVEDNSCGQLGFTAVNEIEEILLVTLSLDKKYIKTPTETSQTTLAA